MVVVIPLLCVAIILLQYRAKQLMAPASINAMIWLARSGAAWRDLPERYGPWTSVYSRFRKWIEDGILDNIFRVLSLEAELGDLSIDATIVQAHQH